jgi:hypothetical protein
MRKPEEKRAFGRQRRRRDDRSKLDFKGIALKSAAWIKLAQDREKWRAVVNMEMNRGIGKIRRIVAL